MNWKRIALMVALLATPALTVAANRPDDIDAKTKEVLKKAGKLIKDAKSMQCEATIQTSMPDDEDGKKRPSPKFKGTVAFQRPDKFAMRTELEGDNKAGLIILNDGKNFYALAKRLKQYTENKPLKDLTGVGPQLLQLRQQNTGLLFQNILGEDPDEMLLDGVSKAEHVGVEKVNGKDAHHMKFKQDEFDWELWVAADGEPFIVKGTTTIDGPNGKMTITEHYTKWKVNGEMPKDAFEFKAPDGFKKVKMLGQRDEDDKDKDK